MFTTVPATIKTSACLGEALNIIPNLSISNLDAAACIISIAQQAKPIVTGHRALRLPHESNSSTVVVIKPLPFMLEAIFHLTNRSFLDLPF